MDCKVCMYKYDENIRVPYSINSCGHCYCILCLNKLKTQHCPLCRGKIHSKIINRAIIDQLTTSDLKNTSQTKLMDSLQLKGLELDLNLNIKTKHNQCRDFFDTMRENVKVELTKKLEILYKQSEDLITQLDDAEKVYDKELTSLKLNVSEMINDLQQKFSEECNLESLKEKSNDTKVQLNTEKNRLNLIKFDLVFKPAILSDENYLGKIERKMNVDSINNKSCFMTGSLCDDACTELNKSIENLSLNSKINQIHSDLTKELNSENTKKETLNNSHMMNTQQITSLHSKNKFRIYNTSNKLEVDSCKNQ